MKDEAILVTGAAGFIGFHVAQRLLSSGRKVVGLDSVNDYYDPALKRARVDVLKRRHEIPAFRIVDPAESGAHVGPGRVHDEVGDFQARLA